MNDFLNLTEKTVHKARFGHNMETARTQQSYASNRVECGDSHTQPSCVLGRKNRLFCDCGGHREWLDYAVNLILGLLGLDQKISSRVRPLLNWYKLTLLEQIGPKCFAKVSCTQPTLTRPIPQETLCFPACWHLSHPFHSGWGSEFRHGWGEWEFRLSQQATS